MGYFIMAFIVILISGVMVLAGSRTWFQCFPITIFGMAFLLYFAGILHYLNLGLLLILLFAVGSAGYLLIHRKQLVHLWNDELKAFLIMAVILYLVHIGRGLVLVDEYTHWALTVKNMFVTGLMGNSAQSITSYKEYPPFTAVIEWMIMKLDGHYSEANLFRGIGLIHSTLMLSFTEKLMTQTTRKKVMILLAALFFPTMCFYLYTETAVDPTLGVLFGYILYQYFQEDDRAFRRLAVMLGCFAITITKASGAGMAGLLIVLIVIDSICTGIKKESLLTVAAAAAGLAAAKLSWQWSLAVEKSSLAWQTEKITYSGIKNLLQNFDASQKQILIQYLHDYVYPNTSLNFISISYVMWCILLAAMIVILGKYYFKSRRRAAGVMAGTVIAIAAYSITLLLLYYFIWKSALTEGSFYRYMNSLYFGFILAYSFLIYQMIAKKGGQFYRYLPIGMLIVTAAFSRPYEAAKLISFPVNIVNGKSTEYTPVFSCGLKAEPEGLAVLGVKKDAKLDYKYVPYRYHAVKDAAQMYDCLRQRNVQYVYISANLPWNQSLKQGETYEIKRDDSGKIEQFLSISTKAGINCE